MLRNRLEQDVARLRFIEGLSLREIGRRLSRDVSNISRACAQINRDLRMVGIDTEDAELVNKAITAILARCNEPLAVAA